MYLDSAAARALCCTLLLLCGARGARGDCADCRYAPRGDRHEGLAVPQVSKGSFSLLGVEIRPPAPPAAPTAANATDTVHLYFWLAAPETPAIEVQEPVTRYAMKPDRRDYPAGLHDYAWSYREVLGAAGIDVGRLHPLVRSRDGEVYFPAAISTATEPPAGGVYSFVFASGAAIDVRCQVSRQVEGGVLPVRHFRVNADAADAADAANAAAGADGLIPIEWDGKDDQGRPVPPGLYVLKIRGQMLAETLRPLAVQLTFLHHG